MCNRSAHVYRKTTTRNFAYYRVLVSSPFGAMTRRHDKLVSYRVFVSSPFGAKTRRHEHTINWPVIVSSLFEAMTRRHEHTILWRVIVSSPFAFRGEDTNTRQMEGADTKIWYPPTRYSTKEDFVCSPIKISSFRLHYFVSSCLRPQKPKANTR